MTTQPDNDATHRQTEHHELAHNESAYFSTAFCREQNQSERVCIGWIDKNILEPDGTISLLIIWDEKARPMQVMQACLNEGEIDLVVEALLKAKAHMQSLRSDNKTTLIITA